LALGLFAFIPTSIGGPSYHRHTTGYANGYY
jgi:hypothetical protein